MRTLLLADDSLAIQRILELTFAGEDIAVTAVGDGEEAITRIHANPPDIVLADIGLPRRSGYELATYIRSLPALSRTPVLLLAGAFEPVDEERVRDAHCSGVLVKPFEPQQVVARVRELLDSAARQTLPEVSQVVPTAPNSPQPDGGFFDRLDAAFSSRAPARNVAATPVQRLAGGNDDDDADLPVPTMDQLLTKAWGEAARSDRQGAVDETARLREPQPQPDRRSVVAAAFEALLAAEQGEPGAGPVRLVTGTTAPAAPAITDDLVDELTRRILQRLTPDAANHVVADVVADVAERLVKEEIARIRARR